MQRTRGAFTLIEILVVLAIVITLAGLSLAAAGLVGRASRSSRTDAILAGLRLALSQRGAETGSPVAPAEHPLAGSAEPRPAFVRSAGGVAVASRGEALKVADPAWLISGHDRVLLADDRHADAGCPTLYGLQRRHCRVLAAPLQGITRYRELPRPGSATDRDRDGRLDPPYDGSRYGDRDHLVAGTATDAAATTQATLAFALGADHLVDLAALQAVAVGRDDVLLAGGRVALDAERLDAAAWSPGRVLEADGWSPYRLRGSALYDAWGVEILYALDDGDGLHLASAGADGVFRWHPGPDGRYQTAPTDHQVAGDDRDGIEDNHSALAEEYR